jgi:membrane-bound ClpP family serine protease
VTRLDPQGQVLVHGERWQAHLPEGSAEPGELVRITAQHGLVLDVVRAPEAEAAAQPART